VIRSAGPADARAVAALWNHYIQDTLVTFNVTEKPEAEVAALMASRQAAGQAFLVAEEGRLVGFATYAQFRGGAGYARTMEHTVLLAPEARGRGVGHALVAGVHSLFGGVSSANPEGRAFHLAVGFDEVAVLREVGWKWGRLLDLHLMQKIL
jgi:phosphinothricin acetyltransferase